MNSLRPVVEELIRLVKRELCSGAVLIAADDAFETKKVPIVILQGPTLKLNNGRQTMAQVTETDPETQTFEQTRHPKLYHLDFDLIVTAGAEPELLDLQEQVARFYLNCAVLNMGERGELVISEQIPLGGLKRVNLSNLRQSSGRLRVEDCPIYDGKVTTGGLIHTRTFQFHGGVNETRTYPHST